jgi:hypothetical protein
MAKYRIVRDKFAGYEVQIWRWYWPFWKQPYVNTHDTVEYAEKWARNHAAVVVKNLGRL